MITVILVFISNIFMTTAWYGHLKYPRESMLFAILMMIEPKIAPALPPATTTEIPSGEIATYCVLEPGERRVEQIAFAGLTRQHLDDLRAGGALLYVRGVVFYDDDFGVRQHRTFCSVYDPGAFDHHGGFVIPAKPGYNYGT